MHRNGLAGLLHSCALFSSKARAATRAEELVSDRFAVIAELSAADLVTGNLLLSDFSPGMPEAARRQIAFSTNISVKWDVINAQSIPFEDARRDLVIANHML